jgi:hypothetical protein
MMGNKSGMDDKPKDKKIGSQGSDQNSQAHSTEEPAEGRRDVGSGGAQGGGKPSQKDNRRDKTSTEEPAEGKRDVG